MVEAVHLWPEAIQVFGVAGRRQHGQRTAMKRTFETDDAVALGMAGIELRLADQLRHAFVRLGARIAEEHAVGKGVGHQPLRQTLGLRHPIQV
jgi:hypothetical protein